MLDAGALIAVERRDRATLALLRFAESRGFSLRTHAMVVGEVWRGDSGRQANLARLLEGVDIRAVDGAFGPGRRRAMWQGCIERPHRRRGGSHRGTG